MSNSVLLISFGLTIPLLAQSSGTLPALLDKISNAYANTDQYDILVESSTVQTQVKAAPATSPNLGFDRIRPNLIHLVRSGRSMRMEIQNAVSRRPYLTVSDGKTEWRMHPSNKEYIEGPAASWPDPPNAQTEGLANFDWMFFSRFGPIRSAAPNARLVGMDQTCDNAETAHVEIHLTGQPQRNFDWVKENLWINTGTGLVCKMESKQAYTLKGQPIIAEKTTTWKYARLQGPIDVSLFKFTPPPNARRVKEFRRDDPVYESAPYPFGR